MKLRRLRALAAVGSLCWTLTYAGALQAQEAAPADAPQAAPQPQTESRPSTLAPPLGTQSLRIAPPTANGPANGYPGGGNPDDRPRDRAGLEGRLRGLMATMGLQEAATQDALITYLADDEKSKNDIREAARRLMVGLKREATPDRMKDLISAYKNALENDKIRRRAAQASLDAKIGYSTNPRLEAMLWVVGVLGDGYVPMQIGQPNNRMPGPRPVANPPATRNVDHVDVLNAAPGIQILVGTLESKTDGYVEVRDQGGQLDRYLPRQINGAAAAGDANCLDQIQNLAVGQRVRIEWTMADGRRLISIQPAPVATLSVAPPPAPEPANP